MTILGLYIELTENIHCKTYEPINCLYLVGSTRLDSELLSLFKFVIMGVFMDFQSIMSNVFNISIT